MVLNKIHNRATQRTSAAARRGNNYRRSCGIVRRWPCRSFIGCNSSNGCWWSRSQQCGTDADSPVHCSAFWVNTNTANPRSWKILHQFPRVTNTRIQGTAVLWLRISYTTFIRASRTANRSWDCRVVAQKEFQVLYLTIIPRYVILIGMTLIVTYINTHINLRNKYPLS